MKKKVLVWPVVLAMLGYLVFNYVDGRTLSQPAFLGKLLIVGVAAASFFEAATACWMVLTSPDVDLGKLADYRLSIAVGLVAGLIFAGLTCASEFGVDISREPEPPAKEQESSDAGQGAQADAPTFGGSYRPTRALHRTAGLAPIRL